jgi:hypothetical protein
MIDWESLYNRLLEVKKSEIGEKHHVVPRYAGGTDADGIVVLPRRYHILAHFIRYRWLKGYGDRVAYKIMSSQLVNPMHDPELKAKHKALMQTEEQREKRAYSKSEETKKKFKEARKKYIKTLSDVKILTAQMQTRDVIEKRRTAVKKNNKENPERVKVRAQKSAQTTKERNKHLPFEELTRRYSRPTVNNGKWRGYVVIEKEGTTTVFETIKIAAQELNLGYNTLLQAIKRGTGTSRSILHNATIYLKKEL